MISIIVPYYSKYILEELNKIDDEKEIIVPKAAYKNHENKLIKVEANNFEEFIEKSFSIFKGDKILFLGGIIDANIIKKMIDESDNADIVYLKRKKQSRLAKFFIHLILPSSRNFSDPLTQIFIVKKDVIKGKEIKPVEKLLVEIIARGNYHKIKEVKADAKIKFSRNYRGYSKYLLHLAWQEKEMQRFIKFGIVGITSVLINEFVLWAALPLGVLAAGIIGIEAGTMSAFIMNDLWTFWDRGKRGIKNFFIRMGKYHAFTFVGAVINLTTLLLLTGLGMHPLDANIIGLTLAFIWNFLTNNFIVWSI